MLKDTLLKIEEEKSPASSGNRTHELSDMRHVLYRCATTAAQIGNVGNLAWYPWPLEPPNGDRSHLYKPRMATIPVPYSILFS